MLSLARYLAGQVADKLEVEVLQALRWLSWRRRRNLARRERERPREVGHWFTRGEATVVGALAALILPSDDTGPGATEADVTAALDRLLARSPLRQRLYRYGLLACDEWALHEHRRPFIELTADQQRELLRWVDPANARFAGASSVSGKILRKAVAVYRKWRCPLVELFPQLARDVMGAFYTHRVSWEWLGYDGPPMPDGYPDLRERPASSMGARSVREAS